MIECEQCTLVGVHESSGRGPIGHRWHRYVSESRSTVHAATARPTSARRQVDHGSGLSTAIPPEPTATIRAASTDSCETPPQRVARLGYAPTVGSFAVSVIDGAQWHLLPWESNLYLMETLFLKTGRFPCVHVDMWWVGSMCPKCAFGDQKGIV